MSMTITVDPSGLDQAQREAVAGFILAFPTNSALPLPSVRDTVIPIRPLDRGEALPSEVAADGLHTGGPFPGYTPPADVSPELAFGSAAAPLPAGAVVAPPVPTAPQAAAVTEQPTAPVPPAPATVTPGVAVDKDGLPWDARIHSSNKATIANGTWRKKRGVTVGEVAAVEAELRAVMGAAPAAPAAPVSAAPPPPVPASAPALEQPQAPAAPVVDHSAFVTLVGRASAALQAGKLSQAEIAAACAAVGMPALPMLANRPDLVPAVAADIDARIAAKG